MTARLRCFAFVAMLAQAGLSGKAGTLYRAGATLPQPPPVPALNEMNTAVLQQAVAASILCGADFLLRQIEDYTNEWTWAVAPTECVVGHREKIVIERRCSTRVVQVPDYEEKWEKYYTIMPIGGESEADRVKFRRVEGRRLISRRQIGFHNETVLYEDPNGTIVRKSEIPTGPIIGDLWQPGFLGQNAMVLYALLKAGVPEYEPNVQKLAQSLKRAVTEFDVPDVTWDVAWLSAAFCNLTEGQYETVRNRTVNRLLDGQIADGTARGLWGPVCINMRLLAAFIAYDQSLDREHERLKAWAEARPRARDRAGKVLAVEDIQQRLFDVCMQISQHGHRFDKVTERFKLDDGQDLGTLRETWTAGVPYFFYNQTLADMDSTALALFAIREAAESGFLPDATVHPTVNQRVLLPPEKTSAILARAANAIAARQRKDGTWDAGLIHEKSYVFHAVQVAPRIDLGLFKLDSPTNLLTTAQGFAALVDAGCAAGFDKLQSLFGVNLQKGRLAQLAAAAGYLDNADDVVVPIKGNLAPQELLFQFARIHCPAGGFEETRRDLWLRLARRAVGLQSPDGSWGDGTVMLDSSSAWDYMDNRARVLSVRQDPAGKLPAYDSRNYWMTHGNWRRIDARLACTSWSMLFLLAGARPPVAGFMAQPPDSPLAGRYIRRALEFLKQEAHLDTRMTPLTTETAGLAASLPLLALSSTDQLAEGGARMALERLLANGGTAVLIGMTNAPAASAAALLPFVPGGRTATVPESAPFRGKYRGKTCPVLQAVVREDGQLAILLLPVAANAATRPTDGRLTPAEGVLTIAALIEEFATRTGLCTRAYPAQLSDRADPYVARVRLLNSLDTFGRGAAADETWDPPAAP